MFDASYKEGKAGLGIVIKGKNNNIKKRKSKLVKSKSAQEAEYLALILLLRTSLNRGILNLHTKGDCLSLIKDIKRNYSIVKLKSELSNLMNKFQKLSIGWISRKHNKQAHKLAKDKLCS